MKTISRRLQKLERSFAYPARGGYEWGALARFRDEIVGRAEQVGAVYGSEIRAELEQLGPAGLLRETARSVLADHGFIQSADESFAETMARAFGIDTDQLRILIAHGQIGPALLERFGTGDTCR